MMLSPSPFARGLSFVTLWCWKPISSENSLNSEELKGGPLSVSKLSRIPCVAKMFRNLSQVTRQDVVVVCSTIGNRVFVFYQCLCFLSTKNALVASVVMLYFSF